MPLIEVSTSSSCGFPAFSFWIFNVNLPSLAILTVSIMSPFSPALVVVAEGDAIETCSYQLYPDPDPSIKVPYTLVFESAQTEIGDLSLIPISSAKVS